MLNYNPNLRKKPLELLASDFFEELREENVHLQEKNLKYTQGKPLPDLFNFTEEEVGSTNADLIKKLVPTWYSKIA